MAHISPETFNRTSLELKPFTSSQDTVFFLSFNRTSLELKRAIGTGEGSERAIF